MKPSDGTTQPSTTEFDRARAVKKAHENELMKRANVIGVGIGYQKKGENWTGQVALIVLVAKKLPAEQLSPKDLLPSMIDGVTIDVQEVGRITAQS
ncbi:MAG: hypothetical protein P4L50_09050 [Anaerolineaceae bacterium]|nr:hypothetical protein [Anaerolineaceae bacterium]